MTQQIERGTGTVVRYSDLVFRPDAGCLVSQPVGPAIGAQGVILEVVRIPAGHRYSSAGSAAEENNVVVFAGRGAGHVGDATEALERGGTVHAPTGSTLVVDAAE